MKFTLILAALASVAAAQQVTFLAPASHAKIPANKDFTISLHQDNSASDLQQVSLTIAAKFCGDKCPSSVAGMGLSQILYNGTFAPKYDQKQPQKGLHQDFKFHGKQLQKGMNMISVVHYAKTGAVRIPVVEVAELVVNVV